MSKLSDSIHNILNKMKLLTCRLFHASIEKHVAICSTGTVKINDINMYYELHGRRDKKSLILIAGFSCDHTFWASILPDLCKKYEVLIFDNRGIGQTDSPDHPYSIEMMADDAMALSHQLGLKNPTIVGQSMGSAIAQEIGKRYKTKIDKIVLINTFDHLTKAPEMAFELTGELMRLNISMNYRVQSIVPWVFSSEFLSQPNQLANLIKITEDNPYPQSFVGYTNQLSALKSFDSRTWLDEIKVPALIIASEEDIIAPLAGSKAVQKGIGNNTQVVMIPGGHASPIEQPARVVDAMMNFID